MSIIKYKLVKRDDGATQAPSYVKDGGYYGDDDNTLIGWADEFTEFEKPDSLRELTKSQVIDRVLTQHHTHPMSQTSDVNLGPGRDFTDQEVIDLVSTWWDGMYEKHAPSPEEEISTLDNFKKWKTTQAYKFMKEKYETSEVEITVSGANVSFGCDSDTEKNVEGVNLAFSRNAVKSNTVNWAPKGHTSTIPMTEEELKEVGGAMFEKKDTFHQVYFTHKASIMAANNFADVMKYDYTEGY